MRSIARPSRCRVLLTVLSVVSLGISTTPRRSHVEGFTTAVPQKLTRLNIRPFFARTPRLIDNDTDATASKKERQQQTASQSTNLPQPEDVSLTMPSGNLTENVLVQDNSEINQEKCIMLGLLWLVAAISALDRVAMSVALVPISSEFGFSDSVKGSISSLFSVGYGLAILPAGIILSTLSPRLVMASGVALWSLATIATPASAELLALDVMSPLLFVRACVGAGEAMVIPSIQRFLARWTTADEKSTAFAFIFSGFQAGNIAAYLLSPAVMDSLGGWKGLFYVYGTVGLLLLIPWLTLAKDAPTLILSDSDKGIDSKRKLEVTSNTDVQEKSSWEDSLQAFTEAPLGDFARSKGAWGMLLAHSAKNNGLYILLAWLPTFYAEAYGIGVRDSAWLSVLPCVAGAVGGFIAGPTADSILRNSNSITVKSTTRIRKVFQSIGLLGPAAALGALAWNIPEEAWQAQLFLMATLGLQSFNAAGFEAGNQDKAGPKWAGMLYSITSLPAIMVGTFGVWLTGRVLDVTNQDWGYVFSGIAGINILGAVAFILLFDSKREFD